MIFCPLAYILMNIPLCMRIQLYVNKMNVSPDVRLGIEEKLLSLSRFLKRMEAGGELLLEVEIARSTKHHRSGDVFYAEATIKVPGKTLRAEEYGENVLNSIDGVRDKLKHEIIRFKEKYITGRKRKIFRDAF